MAAALIIKNNKNRTISKAKFGNIFSSPVMRPYVGEILISIDRKKYLIERIEVDNDKEQNIPVWIYYVKLLK